MAKPNDQYLLDFERPIFELERKLDEMRSFAQEDKTVDLSAEIKALESRVDELRQSGASNRACFS